ncbi:protein of unknown function [Candidatus Hydrogenisulfobacillus filiaventi]|uniref:Uncharacterized protein n=1 Tax=Candidatus Hydrogenisulfobacillus filiaventi TaxID=2707344 RepID=A0A6F8ZIW8_9FIRM|nr:protein of unknown function [Candidatus Hydrogenisulfobacillus filiaventi]
MASIPLAAPPAQMTVRVPHPRWPYSAVGVTMEASPYVRHPSNRRVFFAPLANRKSTGYPQA